MKKHLLCTRRSINVKNKHTNPQALLFSIVSQPHTPFSIFTPPPQPWPVCTCSWAGGITSGLVSLPGVSLSKPSSVPCGQGILNPTQICLPIHRPFAWSFLPLGWGQAPWSSILGFHDWLSQRSSNLSLQTFPSDLPTHPEWFAFCPLSRRPHGFPPPSLAPPIPNFLSFLLLWSDFSMNLSQLPRPWVVSLLWRPSYDLPTPGALIKGCALPYVGSVTPPDAVVLSWIIARHYLLMASLFIYSLTSFY